MTPIPTKTPIPNQKVRTPNPKVNLYLKKMLQQWQSRQKGLQMRQPLKLKGWRDCLVKRQLKIRKTLKNWQKWLAVTVNTRMVRGVYLIQKHARSRNCVRVSASQAGKGRGGVLSREIPLM